MRLGCPPRFDESPLNPIERMRGLPQKGGGPYRRVQAGRSDPATQPPNLGDFCSADGRRGRLLRLRDPLETDARKWNAEYAAKLRIDLPALTYFDEPGRCSTTAESPG